MEKVSVIIPAYNAARYIRETIESVLAQTYGCIEIIAIDDGSTDGTADAIGDFGDRVQLIRQHNRGPAVRNAGARVAQGEWLAFLDADDVWLPEKTARQLECAGPGVQMIYSDRLNIGARGSLPLIQSAVQPMFRGDVFIDLLTKGNVITTSSVMMRRSLFSHLGGFSDDLAAAEDWDLWIRAAELTSIEWCPEPLVCYRFHDGMTSKDPAKMCDARREVIMRSLSRPRGAKLPRSLRDRIWSETWLTNAWDATRGGRRARACAALARAAYYRPAQVAAYRDLIKLALNRA